MPEFPAAAGLGVGGGGGFSMYPLLLKPSCAAGVGAGYRERLLLGQPCLFAAALTLCAPVHALTPRYIIQSLPLILFTCVGLALVSLKSLQLVQQRVLHVVPFGALSQFNVVDSCLGILVAGLFMLYFGEDWPLALVCGMRLVNGDAEM